jgi:hypothetical protein
MIDQPPNLAQILAMKAAELRALIRQSAQRPLRICMDDGRTYTISHPDYALVAESALLLVSGPGHELGDADFVVCYFDHLARVEHLKTKKAA